LNKPQKKKRPEDEELQFLSMYKNEDLSNPATLEKISARAFSYRLNRNKYLLRASDGLNFKTIFPFLHNSFIGEINLLQIPNIDRVTLPKMVVSEGSGGAKPLSKYTNSALRKTEIIEFLKPNVKHSKSINVNVQDWNFIYENIPPYASLEPSVQQCASPDYIISLKIGSITYRVGLQQKSNQSITNSLIVDEAKKFIPVDDTSRHTLIIIGFSIIHQETKYFGPGNSIAYATHNKNADATEETTSNEPEKKN